MPLVYQQNINQLTKLAVWHISEHEDFFFRKVVLQNEITHPHKRLQHLAGRYLLKELFDDFPLHLIEIADTKKPFLVGEKYHFSISHCGDYAAVIVSPENRVGVDIEIVSDKVMRIKNKFLSSLEQQMINDLHKVQQLISIDELLTLMWSVKETIFKWYGLGGVDFRDHIYIDKIDVDDNSFTASCQFRKGGEHHLTIRGLTFNKNVLTWTAT